MAAQANSSSKHASSTSEWRVDAGFDATTEQHSPIELPITGVFPECVAGTLYRTGPALFKVPNSDFQLTHWFDGFTHLHRFQLISKLDGSATCKVMYNSRRQVDHLVEKVQKTGRLDTITFGQKRDPCDSFFKKVKTFFQSAAWDSNDANMVNVGVTVFANMPAPQPKTDRSDNDSSLKSLTTLTDANVIKHIDPETLEPLGVSQQTSLHPSLKGPLSAAHAEIDPVTGDIYNYNLDFGATATYRIFRTSAQSGKTEILATISGSTVKPAYIHSFFLSGDYVVLCVWPCLFAAAGIRILWERNMMDALYFDSNLQTRWYVVDRKQGQGVVATFLSDPFFSFHTVNSFQEESKNGMVDIFCDVIQYPNDDIIRKTLYENLVGSTTASTSGALTAAKSTLVRYKLSGIPKAGKLAKTKTADVISSVGEEFSACELPTINPIFKTKKSRYVYAVVNRLKSSFFDGIVKVDLETNQSMVWERDRHTPGEAIFIPNVTDEAEDAGYLLTIVLDGDTATSYLLCLDARTMTEVGRAQYSAAIAFGLHGSHYPSIA